MGTCTLSSQRMPLGRPTAQAIIEARTTGQEDNKINNNNKNVRKLPNIQHFNERSNQIALVELELISSSDDSSMSTKNYPTKEEEYEIEFENIEGFSIKSKTYEKPHKDWFITFRDTVLISMSIDLAVVR